MRIRPEINRSKEQQDGTHAVRLDVRHNGRHRGPMGFSVPVKHWDEARGRVKMGHPKHVAYNAAIAARTAVLESLATEKPEAAAKELWQLALKPRGGNMVDAIRGQVDNPKFAAGTRPILRKTVERAADVLPDVRMGSLAAGDVVAFRKHLAAAGLSANTVRLYMRMLRLLYNLACEDHGLPVTLAFRRQLPKPEETAERIMPVADVKTFAAGNLTGEPAIARDAFMLSVYLGGLRCGDTIALAPKHLEDGGVALRTGKTKALHWVPILPQAQAIIDRYRGGKHLLPMLDMMKPASVNTWLNRRLRIAAAQCGLPPDLSMHWSRGSCTNFLLELEVPLDVLQMILGHARIQQTIDYAAKFDRKRVRAAMEKLGQAMG